MTTRDRSLNDEKYKAVWDCAGDAMAFIDREGLLDCNEAGLRLFGLADREEVIGRPLSDLAPPAQPGGLASRAHIDMHVGLALTEGQSRFECQFRRRDGELFVADIRLHRLQIGGGHAAHAVLRDITARWQAEQQLRNSKEAIEASLHHLANFDGITGLPNRAQFLELGQAALARAAATGRPMVMGSLVINDIGRINNSIGHDAGDAVLKVIGERLLAAARTGDIVARTGGNAFGILFDGCAAEAAGSAMQALLSSLAAPIMVGSHEVCVGPAAGLSVFDQDGGDIWELLQNAETAMRHARPDATKHICFFSSEMSAAALDLLALESGLRRALEHQEFVLHYQPLVTAADRRIIGVEALVRWQHPEWGLVDPDRFIPLAEQTGLILALGEWALRQACRQAQDWATAGLQEIEIAVNLSPRQFHQAALKDMVHQAIADSGLAPGRLVLELTEGALMEHTEHTLRTLAELRSIGVRLALDDFGTGYSSLAYLKRFPIQKLKMDKSFVRDIANSTNDVVIAQAIINLGNNLHLEVIAEGIETAQELDTLRAYGCEYMQGYHFARPLPAVEIESLLREQAARDALGAR